MELNALNHAEAVTPARGRAGFLELLRRRPGKRLTGAFIYDPFEMKEPEADAPSPAAAHRAIGLAYEKDDRKPEAIAELQTAVRLKPF